MSFGVVSDKPRRPLQGYFRFRQELKNLMKGEECTSEYIVSRWNELDVQEIKRREELDRL